MEFNLTNSIIKMQNDASGKKAMSEEDILQEFIALRDYNIQLKKQVELLTKNVKSILEQHGGKYVCSMNDTVRVLSLKHRKPSASTVIEAVDKLMPNLWRPSKAKDCILVQAYVDGDEISYQTRNGSTYISVSD
jgi:hypothetical protein